MPNIIWAGLSALLFPVFVSDTSLAFSNSMFSVLFFAAMLLMLRYASAQSFSPRLRRFALAPGLLFSLMTACGYALSRLGAVPYSNPLFAASIMVYTHVFARILGICWTFLERKESVLSRASIPSGSVWKTRIYGAIHTLLSRPALLFGLLLLCWAPCYLSVFPGNLMYDASYEYYQLETGFTRSFPLLHSAIITRLFSASEHLTGSVNAGVAVYIVTQMLLMAALFTHILRRLRSFSVHPALLGLFTLYYAAFPVIPLLITCTTRDVLFCALLTWLVYLFYLAASDPDTFMASARNVVLLAAVLVFTLLVRNNNSGPLVPFLLFILCGLIALAFGRKHLRRALVFIASALCFFCGVSALLTALCQPLYDSPPASSLSIMAQPIVRAYTLHGETWSDEELSEFDAYFNLDTLEYFPQNADPAKGNLQLRYADVKPFLRFWIHIGLKHPACYMDALLAATHQMWFPACVLDGYTVRGMMRPYEKNYFYFGKYVEEIGSRHSLLPSVFPFNENVGLMISFEKIPVVSMLFSVGFHVWALLNCIFYAAYRKSRHLFWPLLIIAVYTVCCAFIPLVLLRYFGALFFVFPLIVTFTLCPSCSLPARRKD